MTIKSDLEIISLQATLQGYKLHPENGAIIFFPVKMEFAGYRNFAAPVNQIQRSFDYYAGLRTLNYSLNNIDRAIRDVLDDVPVAGPRLFRTMEQEFPIAVRDVYSTSLIDFCPACPQNDGYYAVRVSGDGNCLFNASSVAITGTITITNAHVFCILPVHDIKLLI